jgi:hypothetical protein
MTNAAPSLMDNLEFLNELESMDGAPVAVVPATHLLDRVRAMEDGFVPGQPRLHVVSTGRSTDHSTPDRNAFHPAPIEDDDEDDETSVTISTRVATFAVTVSGLAGVCAAAVVFHERLAFFLR